MSSQSPFEVNKLYVVTELFIAVLAIAGNVLVCWAVSINSTLKNATNYFLVSLAVADILVGCLAIPFAITISTGFSSEFYSCLFLACFVLVLTQSSIFSLLAVAIDRYLAVKIPLRYRELVTGKRAREIIAVFWILSFIIGLIPFLGWNGKDKCCSGTSNGTNTALDGQNICLNASHVNNHSCQVNCYFEVVVDMKYMVYFNFFGCVLPPLLIMLVIYIKIFMVARKQLRQIELKCINGDNSRRLLQKEIAAAKSLSIIMGLFAVCWLPVHILNCVTLFYKKVNEPWVMFMAIILSHFNSVVNPIIYAYRIKDFRNTFRKIIYKYFLCQKDEVFKSTNGSTRHRDLITENTNTDLLRDTSILTHEYH
ncbi:LOW QUALITY PROTEIN: adenosine receptor A2b [Erpetoichthys calabaricus]|uniref:LOW QUALITY PROTEIN: adenosine receptor A2b n=1 Tax=Erpetoichthys calabaricus TaxID=27687 RepID=UPI0022345F43|nr:LOW QUALITY PROTEIN: adenosine receptor A2b [Erpetoichthys calabaricus]